jgi:tetratricopeptide (TPR) repeat protein
MQQMAGSMMKDGKMPPGMGMPGAGMPSMPNNTAPSSGQASKFNNLTTDQKSDLTKAEQLKSEANKMVTEKKFEEACELYFSAINTIRANSTLRNEKPAKECEVACRSNLALCKLNLKQYDQVLDHCEQVLEHDPKNIKVNFRMSQALFALSKQNGNVSMVKSAFAKVKIAFDQSPSDKNIKTFYEEVKLKHDEIVQADMKKESEGP